MDGGLKLLPVELGRICRNQSSLCVRKEGDHTIETDGEQEVLLKVALGCGGLHPFSGVAAHIRHPGNPAHPLVEQEAAARRP